MSGTRVTSRLLAREELAPAERGAMYALLGAHFEGVSPARFEQDLAAKNWALLLEDEQGLVGFSTLLLYESRAAGEPVGVAYSGDTIVDPRGWRSAALPAAWIGAVCLLRQNMAVRHLYWLLLTSGYRTYRMLPVFWREYVPSLHGPAEAGLAALRDALAAERLGAAYDPASGLARFDQPQVLRPHLRGIPPGRQDDPHVRCFLERNPGWQRGDELVCLTEIAWANLTAVGRRTWRRGESSDLL